MARKEDEIQKKLVELEISIKDEEAKHQLPAARHNATDLSTTDYVDAKLQKEAENIDVSLYQIGGYVCIIGSICMLLAHLQPVNGWASLFTSSGLGLMLIPLFVGIGWFFYDFKSKIAQLMTVCSLGAMFFVILSRMDIRPIFANMLDLVMMTIPLCVGAALLLKAHVKRLEGVKELKDNQPK